MAREEKICPQCGARLECKLENLPIGADGGGGFMALLMDQYEVDLYACPKCGRVVLYTAGFDPSESEESSAPADSVPRTEEKPVSGQEERGFRFPWKKEAKDPWEL